MLSRFVAQVAYCLNDFEMVPVAPIIASSSTSSSSSSSSSYYYYLKLDWLVRGRADKFCLHLNRK